MVWFRERILGPEEANGVLAAAGSTQIGHSVRARELLKRPGVGARALLDAAGPDAPQLDGDVLATVEIDTKYEGYVRREAERASRLREQAEFAIPPETPFADFATLSHEARQKLTRVRPGNLAQASRIPGVSPADLQNLVMEVRRRASTGNSASAASRQKTRVGSPPSPGTTRHMSKA